MPLHRDSVNKGADLSNRTNPLVRGAASEQGGISAWCANDGMFPAVDDAVFWSKKETVRIKAESGSHLSVRFGHKTTKAELHVTCKGRNLFVSDAVFSQGKQAKKTVALLVGSI